MFYQAFRISSSVSTKVHSIKETKSFGANLYCTVNISDPGLKFRTLKNVGRFNFRTEIKIVRNFVHVIYATMNEFSEFPSSCLRLNTHLRVDHYYAAYTIKNTIMLARDFVTQERAMSALKTACDTIYS